MGAELRLQVRDLDVTMRERVLLRGFECNIEAGGARVLRGRSGSGKSTLLRTVAALAADPGDRIRIDGRAIAEVGITAWRRSCVYTSQVATMWPGSVQENLQRPFEYRIARGARFEPAAAERLLARLGLPDALARDARELSGGERLRVHVARTLLVRPSVLLLDEPVASLDSETAQDVWSVVREHVEAGAACLIVTHGSGPSWASAIDLEPYRG